MFIRIGDLSVQAWLRTVKTFTGDVSHPISFVDLCIRRVFLAKHKVIPWQSILEVITSTYKVIISTYTDTRVLNVYTSPHSGAASKEKNSCGNMHQIRVRRQMEGEVLVRCQFTGLITIEIHGHFLERCDADVPWTRLGLVKHHGKSFSISTKNLTAGPIYLPEFMVFPSRSSTIPCIIHAKYDGPYRGNGNGQMFIQCNKSIFGCSVGVVPYNGSERHVKKKHG